MGGLESTSRLFLQLGLIAGAGALLAIPGRRLGQPAVVCEMLAGLLLGPSLLGWLAPGLSARLFAPAGMPALRAASQLGLILYMFCVGLEFRVELLKSGWRTSALVSSAGIVVPLLAGAALGAGLHQYPVFFPPSVRLWQAALFGGTAVCITAFPVLARIVSDLGLSGTPLGTLALGSAAFDDTAAWALLAVLLAGLTARPQLAALALGGGAVYALAVYALLRPAARALISRAGPAALGAGGLALTLAAALSAAWTTEALGLHAVFGAFTLGLAMPRGLFAERVVARVAPLTTALLLPVFFAYSGLNTRIGLLDSAPLWLVAVLVLVASSAAKGLACGLAARWSGLPAAESVAVGALMNTRGLMELVLLNIALDRGLITPTTFTIYVMMALATTLAASPLFELCRPRLRPEATRVLPSGAYPSRPRWP
jgi:Kef-type K+ transport system membrane component KefB